MGESTCLMQTFSPPSHEPQEGNPVHVLGESISFGRFMTESLAWEKWSAFNNNRYLEEVEKCSKPGSVAQKKAYFEAHYKKIAAQKAAAALEEENSEINNSSLPQYDDGYCDAGNLDNVGTPDTQLVESAGHFDTNESGEIEVSTYEAGISFDAKECDSNGETGGLESVIVVVDPIIEKHVVEDNSIPVESPSQHEDVETRMTNEVEIKRTPPSEKIPLKENSSANQESYASTMKTKQSVSSSKASVYNRESKLPFTPARPRTPVHPKKENNPNLESKLLFTPARSRTPVHPKKENNPNLESKLPFTPARPRTPVHPKKENNPNLESKLPFTPARPRTPMHPKKESNPNLSSKKTEKDLTDKRRPAPASLHMSLSFTPSQASEYNKRAIPVLQNTKDSKIIVTSTKTPSDCSNSLRTPARVQASRNGLPKRPPLTPYPDGRKIKAPLEQTVHGSRKMDVKWKSLSVDNSKSSSGLENKAPCNVSSSFSLRSEERAAKRKEYFQKLEEDYNAKEAHKLEVEAKSKEKAETELRKLRQNLGFKAKPMPDFYRETQVPKSELKKIPLTRPRSPKLGRKPSSNASHDTISLPPTQTRPVRSTPKKNASPII